MNNVSKEAADGRKRTREREGREHGGAGQVDPARVCTEVASSAC